MHPCAGWKNKNCHIVDDLLSCARDLRRTSDPYVAKNIFINKDLSPDDAHAEYERRQTRRRQNMERRNGAAENPELENTELENPETVDNVNVSRVPIISKPREKTQMIFRNSGRSNSNPIRDTRQTNINLIVCTPNTRYISNH